MADPNAEIPTFGAKDVEDLTWKTFLMPIRCTDAACTDQCPANLTAKSFLRKVMMDTRSHEELASFVKAQVKRMMVSLLSDEYASEERACTTCNACVELAGE